MYSYRWNSSRNCETQVCHPVGKKSWRANLVGTLCFWERAWTCPVITRLPYLIGTCWPYRPDQLFLLNFSRHPRKLRFKRILIDPRRSIAKVRSPQAVFFVLGLEFFLGSAAPIYLFDMHHTWWHRCHYKWCCFIDQLLTILKSSPDREAGISGNSGNRNTSFDENAIQIESFGYKRSPELPEYILIFVQTELNRISDTSFLA